MDPNRFGPEHRDCEAERGDRKQHAEILSLTRAIMNEQTRRLDNRDTKLHDQQNTSFFSSKNNLEKLDEFKEKHNRLSLRLSLRFIRPYEIIERVGPLSYRLVFPPELSRIDNVFHVSMLCTYIVDPSHVLEEHPISLQKDLSYEEVLVQILDRKEQVLRNKTIPLVKVLWRSHQVEEATWESEERMRQQYPFFFV
ncbi:hypothetical protein ACLB2K_050684 [Fragaria x ananassa]